jgi:peptidoglycan/xylan/chitin deacetylase (PgdA/CDA1 family)
MGPLLDASRVTVEARTIDRPVALLSIDLETDYGSGLDEALSQTDRLLAFLDRLDLPLTAFVEGQFFERRKPLCRMLLDAGVDVQLHCYDHGDAGDTPASLRRGALAFEDFCGRPPDGYRAHTYHLTHALYETLLERGFRWDSSLMRGFGQGSNRNRMLRAGDYLVLDGRLVEFPIATWQGTPFPLNHSYRLLIKQPAEALLWALAGCGSLVAYNVHMTDLVRCGSLPHSPIRWLPRLLFRYMWATQGRDTFGALEAFAVRLRTAGYEFLTTQGLYQRVQGARPAGSGG